MITTLFIIYAVPSIFPSAKVETLSEPDDNSVTSQKILDGSVSASDLADNSVIAEKLSNCSVTTAKLDNYSVTDLKLAPSAIPSNFSCVYGTSGDWLVHDSADWTDIEDMEVTLIPNRTSVLVIFFTMQADCRDSTIGIKALVNDKRAYPSIYNLRQLSESIMSDTYSCNFFVTVPPGTCTVQMQWSVYGWDFGVIGDRTLIVIALPA